MVTDGDFTAVRFVLLFYPFLSVFFPCLCFVLQPVGKVPWMCLMSCKQDWHHFRRFIWQCGQGTYLHSTFLSKCLSRRVSASVSPPGHTAEDKPSVSKPEGKERREPTPLLSLLWYRNHFVSDPISLRKKKKSTKYISTGLYWPTQDCTELQGCKGPHRPTQAHTGLTQRETPAPETTVQLLSSGCTSSHNSGIYTCYRIYKIFRLLGFSFIFLFTFLPIKIH